MDFHSMKRKELQSLCKQHNIRANSTNLEMANKLTQLFKEKENHIIETNEVSTETESSNVLVSKKIKKVRFSPENELIEFTRSQHKTKRSRRSVVLCKNSNLSVENVNSVEELNGDGVDRPVRMRLRRRVLLENAYNVSKKGRKKLIEDQVSVGKIEDGHVRMQLRRKTLKENFDNVSKRGRKRVIIDKIENDENRVGTRRSLRSKGIASEGTLAIGVEVKSNGKGKEEALEEPKNLVGRSNRRVSTVGSWKMVVEDSEVGAEVTTKSKIETVAQNQDCVKVELRRSRRKPVLPSGEQLDPSPISSMFKTKEQLVKPCVIDKEASFVQKNTRRLKRHATNSPEVSDEFGGDDIIQRKNETRKKKKVNVSIEDVVIGDSSNSAQSIIGVFDGSKPSSIIEESDFVEGSLQDGVIEIMESLGAQMSVPEVTSGFKQKHLSKIAGAAKLKEIQDNSIVTSTALIVMNENEPSRMKDLACEKYFPEMVVDKALSSLEADVQVSNEENIIVADNDDVAAQMTSLTEVSTFHANCEEVTENSNVCENEVSPENSLLAGAFTFDDKTDVKIDLEGIEAEAEECIGPKVDLLDLVSEHQGVCAQETPGPVEPVFINDVSLPLSREHGTDMELLVAPSSCYGTDREKRHNFTPMRWSDTENSQTEYDLNDVDCLNESNISPVQSNEATAEKSGVPKNSGGYDTLFNQSQSDDKYGVTKISGEKLAVSNISRDNMSMEKTILDGEHEATKQAKGISNGFKYEPATLANNRNCSRQNEDSIEARNADVESLCDTVITELELERRLSEVNFQDIMVTEIQNGQIGKGESITPNWPNEDSCQETKMTNLETSMNKSTVTRGVCSSIQNEELNMDGEKESECQKSFNKSSFSEQENELPVKFEASSIVDEASGSERILRFETCDEDYCSARDDIVIENNELHKDGEKENEFEKSHNESSIFEREEHDLQSLFATPIKSVDSCMVDEASGSESILKATSSQENVCSVKKNVVTETMSNDRIERGKETDLRLLSATPNRTESSYKVNGFCRSESKLEESCMEKVCFAKQQESHDKVAEAGYHEVFNTEFIAGNDENVLQLLFATPNKIEFSCEANKIRGSESKNALEECTVEKVCPMKQNTSSHEEVGVAGHELTNNLSPEAPTTEALVVDTDFLDNLACANDSRVNCGEELAQSSGNLDTVSVATLCDNLNRSREEYGDERTADVEICTFDDANEKLEVTSLSDAKFHDTVVNKIQDQDLLGCNITTNVGGKLSEDELGQNGQENELLFMFSTPNKSEASNEANEKHCSETKIQESCMEKASSTEQLSFCEKVGDAISDNEVLKTDCVAEQYEINLQLLFATPSKVEAFCASECKLEESCTEKVAPNSESMKDEDLNLVNGLEVANLDSSTVLPVAFEASKENWTGETYEQKKGTSSLSVEPILSPGQTYLDEESKDDDQDSAEIISTLASPLKYRNESYDEKLLDIESAENLKLPQSSELISGFANCDTIQECSKDSRNNHYFAAYSQGSNIKRVTSTDAFLEPSSSEMANDESGIDVVTDKEIGSTFLDEQPLFRNLEMHLLSGDNDYESSNCNHKEGKDILRSSTDEIVNKLSVSELHFQNEIDSRFEILKESDVMETIQEYTNYESSNSIDIDRSGVTLPIKASTEASKISYSVDEPSDDSILDEVSALRRCSTAKKAVRTILIHGTPNKVLVTADMKENDPLKKKPLIGDITIKRPAKRRALQNIEYN